MDFGKRISLHRGTVGAGGWWWLVAAVLVLAGVTNLARAAAPAHASDAALMGAIALGIGLVCFVAPVMRWRQRVEVFERGFVWSRVYGSVAVPSREVRGASYVHYRNRAGAYDEVEIALAGNRSRSIVIAGLENAGRLCVILTAWSQGRVPS